MYKLSLQIKEEKISELNGQVTKLTEEKNQLDKDLNSAKQSLNEKDKELENKNKELENKIQELEALKSASEKLKGEIQQLESRVKELEALKSEDESQIKDLQKQLESRNKELEDNKDSKPSAVNAQGVKSKVNYASASFILSGMCAVGASLATPYLAICVTLAVAASVFLALGFYCLYKANTTLSNVKVDQQDNQRLLESSL
jgi:myosin heavy subunit